MRKVRGTQGTFWLALVDTLTCALGSLLLLWMALAATPPGKPSVPGQAALLQLTIDSPVGQQPPELAIRFRIGGRLIGPEEARETGRLIVDPPQDGSSSYSVIVTGVARPDEEMLVYLNDLRGQPKLGEVLVRYELSGPRVEQPSGVLNLKPHSPMCRFSLRLVTEGKPLSCEESP